MTRQLLEVLVEDRSTEQALRHLMPLIAPHCSFNIRSFDGKHGLMKRLPGRLRGYAERVRYDPNLRIVVVVDLDDDNCHELKKTLEDMTRSAGLTSLRSVRTAQIPIVATRIAKRLLQSHSYHNGGMRKIALADEVARHMDVENNRSTSFCCLRDGIRSLTSWKVA